jgi:hypothetical protein
VAEDSGWWLVISGWWLVVTGWISLEPGVVRIGAGGGSDRGRGWFG